MSATNISLSNDEMRTLGSNWGWSLTAGIIAMLAGVIAIVYSVSATFLSLAVLASLMIVSGIALVVHGVRTRQWSGFLLDLFGAAVIIAAAVLMIRSPVASVLSVTMFLALYFIVSGIAETIGGFAGTYRSTGWAVFDGLISILLGGLLLASWPTSGLWFLGFAVGVKLLLMGGGLTSLAMAARRRYNERGGISEIRRAA